MKLNYGLDMLMKTFSPSLQTFQQAIEKFLKACFIEKNTKL